MLKFTRVPISFILVFDQSSYLIANDDIRIKVESGELDNALEHFILYGYDEVQNGTRRIGSEYPFMTEKEYYEVNLDVSGAVEDGSISSAFEHFIAFGYGEFQNNTRRLGGSYQFEFTESLQDLLKVDFDEEAYLKVNEDVKTAISKEEFKSAWEHFINNGIEEIRRGERSLHSKISFLSESEYVYVFRDIFDALKNGTMNSPYEHFLLHGSKEIIDGSRRVPGVSQYFYDEPELTKEIESEMKAFEKQPLISIIIPVYNVDALWLKLAIESLQKQWYTNWELCIADDKSTKEETVEYLNSLDDEKIKIVFLEKNLNISGASNEALALTTGDYIALMDNDDELTPDALYEVVKTINEKDAEFIYSDEDKLEMDGSFSEPHFKPDYAPDMFLSQNYISHLGVIKKSLIDEVGGFTQGLEGSQDYDLYLRVLEHTDKVQHISKVLYHWRKVPGSTAAEFSDKSYAQDAGKMALQNAMKRRGVDSTVENGKYPGTYRVRYEIQNEPLVSIVIPFKDKPELLDMCINSVLEKSTYENYEIIGISNNSQESETFEMMKLLQKKDSRILFYEYNVPFNYSDINNYAVNNYAKGEHIVLLNNDIEIISPEWIEAMLEFSQRKSIGAVGAKLYYPNDTIQHAGIIIGIGGVAGHSHKYFDKEATGYFSRLNIVNNFSAVTAACLMVKKDIYNEVGGLDEENLKIAFNDVDFCLRVQEHGYRNIYIPYCEAYHHESISRGAEDNPEKVERFNKEVEYMKNRHKEILESGDPYYNVNLTLDYENFKIKG
jgi:GT2 family glycosyltransferase